MVKEKQGDGGGVVERGGQGDEAMIHTKKL